MNFRNLIICSVLLLTNCNGGEQEPKENTKEQNETKQFENNFEIVVVNDNAQISNPRRLDNIIQTIVSSSDRKKGESTIANQRQIADEVFDIVYNTPNTELSIEQRMDIIQLLVFYNRHATDTFRSDIERKIDKKDSLVLSNPLFLLPLSSCEYCNSRIEDALFKQKQIKTPVAYKDYSNSTTLLLSNQDHKNNKDSIMSISDGFKKANEHIVFSDSFAVKYRKLLKF